MKPQKFQYFDVNFPTISVPNGINLLYYQDIDYGKMFLHTHNFIEIMLVMEGQVSISHEGVLYSMSPGDISLVPSGLFHNTIIHEGTKKYERYVVHIDNRMLNQVIKKHTNDFKLTKIQTPLVFQCDAEDTFYLKFIMNQIAHNNNINDKFSMDVIRHCLYNIFVFFERKFHMPKSSMPELSNPMVREVIEYINRNFTSTEINVSDIAANFFVSEGYLSKLFKKFTGTTVYNYIIEKRLSYTRELINDGGSIQDSCYASGFCDYTSYLKAFKKKYSMTPTEYKKNKDTLYF